MKNILIVEKNQSELSVQEDNKYLLGGPFTEFGIKNRNDRVYEAAGFLPCLEELQTRMRDLGVVYGEYDHPDVFDMSLSRASHFIKEIEYVKENNRVEGKIKLLNNYWGREARSLVDDGLPLFVSSRAAGITENNGSVTLKKLFTYDIVADPGFSSAKMSPINESLGYNLNSNYRIYEVNDESQINDFFNMNKNDLVTKEQLSEYSKYLVEEIAKTQSQINETVKGGNLDAKKMEELLERYDSMNESNTKIIKYLDYLAEKMSVFMSDNANIKKTTENLKLTTNNLIKHNDYLAEKLEQSIEYAEYIAENLDKSIEYSEYIAENVDKSIEYSEYIAENVDKSIEYAEYLAENLDKSIEYAEYLAENLDKSIEYAEYIAENVDSNIAYSEYLAENLDDSLAYVDYLAENLDNSINYTNLIAEKLNSNSKINEAFGEEDGRFPSAIDMGFEEDEEDEVYGDDEEFEGEEAPEEMVDGQELPDNCEVVCDDDEETEEILDEIEDDENAEEVEINVELDDDEESEEESEEAFERKDNLDLKIDELIKKVTERKVTQTKQHSFLSFLNKSQIDSFYALSPENQTKVVTHLNEKSYMSSRDVLILMKEALDVEKAETLEDRLVRLMPDAVSPLWEKLTNMEKMSVISQAKLRPEMRTEDEIVHFWETRDFVAKNGNVIMLNEESSLESEKLTDAQVKAILERMKNV